MKQNRFLPYLIVLLSFAGAVDAAKKDQKSVKTCQERRLFFSANELLRLDRGSAVVWGGGAAPWDETAINARTYTPEFLARVRTAKQFGIPVFAYLEGPCGDTGGNDDGERSACARKHRLFIEKISKERSSRYKFLLAGLDGKGVSSKDPKTRWFPYTFAQLLESGVNGVSFCEVDNLDNNVRIDLNVFLKKYKSLYDAGEVGCQLVLKNVSPTALAGLVKRFSQSSGFLAPFHIFEADDLWKNNRKEFDRVHARLNSAMVALKGPGSVTLMSKRTTAYASSNFTQGKFKTCTGTRTKLSLR